MAASLPAQPNSFACSAKILPTRRTQANCFLSTRATERTAFWGNRAVSWHADNDFSNVGYRWDWIREEEKYRLALMKRFAPVAVFRVRQDLSDNRDQQRMRQREAGRSRAHWANSRGGL